METAYATSGIEHFAAWTHETDDDMRGDLERRGYTLREWTHAMGMTLDDIATRRPEVNLGPSDWHDYLRVLEVSPDLVAGGDHTAFHVLIARLGGDSVGAAMAFDHHGDCGIYNVVTVEHARRKGIGTALTAIQLHDAVARGCTTASLQSTDMATGIYRAVGFRDLGRLMEYGRNHP
jgi:GNAT superfamily N-acetyltransferase